MKSNHFMISLFIGLSLFLFSDCQKTEQDSKDDKTLILLDSDMVEAFDDGISFMILLASENVEIKGLTTVTGNAWAHEALAYGIRIGELCGGSDLTYIAGAQYPMRPGRLDELNRQIDANPGEDSSYRGAISYPEVTDWESFYTGRYGEKPKIRPSSQDPAEFIAQQVMSAPGKVTIVAIGPCTNVAKAILAHPEMASKAKEIIYMGGAVFCPGNTTPYAEMNFIYDPEAAAVCLRAPFPKQTIVSLDVCNTVKMTYDTFMEIYNSIESDKIRQLFRDNYAYKLFEDDPTATQLVWDLISAAIAIDHSIISDYRDVRLDLDDHPETATYGQSYPTEQSSRQVVRVPLSIDREKFWNIVTSRIRVLSSN